ncbi:MAG TPA: hypothetical protein VNS09_13115 [Solirubrobacter sp.]|nr:hypothetical protein [Solirubrobacter sp.]
MTFGQPTPLDLMVEDRWTWLMVRLEARGLVVEQPHAPWGWLPVPATTENMLALDMLRTWVAWTVAACWPLPA